MAAVSLLQGIQSFTMQKAVTGSFSVLCLTSKSPLQDGPEKGFGWLWVLLVVIINSMLRKDWGAIQDTVRWLWTHSTALEKPGCRKPVLVRQAGNEFP